MDACLHTHTKKKKTASAKLHRHPTTTAKNEKEACYTREFLFLSFWLWSLSSAFSFFFFQFAHCSPSAMRKGESQRIVHTTIILVLSLLNLRVLTTSKKGGKKDKKSMWGNSCALFSIWNTASPHDIQTLFVLLFFFFFFAFKADSVFFFQYLNEESRVLCNFLFSI